MVYTNLVKHLYCSVFKNKGWLPEKAIRPTSCGKHELDRPISKKLNFCHNVTISAGSVVLRKLQKRGCYGVTNIAGVNWHDI